ncbi:MAG: ribbon-helix-helix domain-containing protein [Candidatus Bathyarchaeota archaeon]|nr:ribbon-helix-helix domain-containing protein [Candidatus Bathyarchaeota archaeon]
MAKVGTSIRMDSDILRWIDDRVKERIFASRTHAFEYAIRQLMKSERRQRG